MWELTDHIIHCYLTNNLRDEIHAKMPLKLNYYCKHCILFNFKTNGLNWSKLISTWNLLKIRFYPGDLVTHGGRQQDLCHIKEIIRYMSFGRVGICSWVLNTKLFLCRLFSLVSTLTSKKHLAQKWKTAPLC